MSSEPLRDLQGPGLTKLALMPRRQPDGLVEKLRSSGYVTIPADLSLPISTHVRAILQSADLVLLDLTRATHNDLKLVERVSAVIEPCSLRPRLLCFSWAQRNPHFILCIEKCGARYIRIASPEILLEAIDLLLTEMNDLERNGPSFEIIHRFSRGSCCVPGEEISTVLLAHEGYFFQLPLGLAQRFVFDFLAQRRLAVDSLQIVSGLAGDWFYREHAANSGQRQVQKIRRATVKVLIQRIREAMAATFAKANLKCDPCDVLRSCPAEGSKRVLYTLRGTVRWRHIADQSR
jgi:hypothetical protein